MEAMTDALGSYFPRLAEQLPTVSLADLPTPLETRIVESSCGQQTLLIKRDDLSNKLYGGNKVRKLEYLLQRARARGAARVATFGTVASNHALATAMYASALGLGCTCLLSHQSKTPTAPLALNMHLRMDTEIVRFGGTRATRVATMRRYLQGRKVWVIPIGGTSWLGVIGFVNAALELAGQIDATAGTAPDRVYVATGTMGTAAGLALGMALAGLPTEIHAVRVSHESIANREDMRRLLQKTAYLMRRLDPAVPANLAHVARLRMRDRFFAGGYAKTDVVTDNAVAYAKEALGLRLDTTYTGKAMAALLHDLGEGALNGRKLLFWNTYNSRVLPVSAAKPDDTAGLPDEFLRYYV